MSKFTVTQWNCLEVIKVNETIIRFNELHQAIEELQRIEKKYFMNNKVKINVEYVESIPDLDLLEDNKMYVSEKYKTSVHKCFCGCGEKTVIPLSSSEWRLTKHENGSISLSPSISNYQFKCRSHYVISNNEANFV